MKKNIDLVVCTGFRIHAVKRKHGGKRMNIKEVEKVTGISSQNIRFYEKSGLVHPDRNEENGYREYDTNDIRILKLIKMFRMIDMPIEQIKLILLGQGPVSRMEFFVFRKMECWKQINHLLCEWLEML